VVKTKTNEALTLAWVKSNWDGTLPGHSMVGLRMVMSEVPDSAHQSGRRFCEPDGNNADSTQLLPTFLVQLQAITDTPAGTSSAQRGCRSHAIHTLHASKLIQETLCPSCYIFLDEHK
jgi:hypothetical protein